MTQKVRYGRPHRPGPHAGVRHQRERRRAAAAAQFAGLSVGSVIKTGQVSWTVVGIFESGGSVGETELWADSRIVQGAYRRGNSYTSVLARLESPAQFKAMKDWLTTNPQLDVSVEDESKDDSDHSVLLTTLIEQVGYAIAILMGVGAVFGAILTMNTAVSTRTREIATLRALGFNTASVIVSVLVESLLLGAHGRPCRRHPGLRGVQRLPDVDDELPDVQPGRLRVRGDAGCSPRG